MKIRIKKYLNPLTLSLLLAGVCVCLSLVVVTKRVQIGYTVNLSCEHPEIECAMNKADSYSIERGWPFSFRDNPNIEPPPSFYKLKELVADFSVYFIASSIVVGVVATYMRSSANGKTEKGLRRLKYIPTTTKIISLSAAFGVILLTSSNFFEKKIFAKEDFKLCVQLDQTYDSCMEQSTVYQKGWPFIYKYRSTVFDYQNNSYPIYVVLDGVVLALIVLPLAGLIVSKRSSSKK